MRRFIFGLAVGNNNAYCLLFWIITGLLFVLAMIITIVGTPVFQVSPARQPILSEFQQQLKNFDNTDAELQIETPRSRSNRNWAPMIIFSLFAVIGIIVLVGLRKRVIGSLLIGFGLLIAFLAYWHYGILTLWILFFASLFWSMIYTPIAFRDEVAEAGREAYEKFVTHERVEGRINPVRAPEGSAPPEGGSTNPTTPRASISSQGRWWARILSMDLLAEFISGFVRRIFRFR